MTRTKKIRLAADLLETTVIRRVPARSAVHFCTECDRNVVMVGVDMAARAFGLRTLVIMKGVGDGDVHYRELDSGTLLLCTDSLKQLINGGEDEQT